MAVSPEGLSINPRLRDGVNGLVAVEAEELRDDSGGSNLDKNDVVETDTVERVQEGKAALNFVSLDHGFENVADTQRLALASKVVSDGQDGTKVVGWVTP